MTDSYTKKESERSRTVQIIDFTEYPFALSGIMLVSAIEQNGARYIITPHISDNVGNLVEGFFVFFEVYDNKSKDTIDFVYRLLKPNQDVVSASPRIRKIIDSTTTRMYLKIERQYLQNEGTFTLEIIALKPSDSASYTQADFLAVAQRSIKVEPTIAGQISKNLDKAIDQLRYVATTEDMDYIKGATNFDEKQARFNAFWKKLDPTPNTERNEAEEQYYARIDYANKNFRSYTDGWLTDKGMVFIIYGMPGNMEKYSSYGDYRVYERWTYRDGREFIFVDNNGFGDFRLAKPLFVDDKYHYQS